MSNWLNLLVKTGHTVVHEPSKWPGSGSNRPIRVRVTHPDHLNWVWDKPVQHSLESIYRTVAVLNGYATAKDQCPEAPMDLRVEDNGETVRFSHPSFAVATLSKYSGRRKPFMSPIEVDGGMSIRVHAAELQHRKDLGVDNVFSTGGAPIIEFHMTVSQFAEWIMSQGKGEGVPCTISYAEGLEIDGCHLPTAMERLEQNAETSMIEAVADMEKMLVDLSEVMEKPGTLSAKDKKEIWGRIKRLASTMTTKPSWLMKIYKRHADTQMLHAKTEFASWAERHVELRKDDVKSLEQ